MDPTVEFITVDNPHANKLTVHILAAVSQHERQCADIGHSQGCQSARQTWETRDRPRPDGFAALAKKSGRPLLCERLAGDP